MIFKSPRLFKSCQKVSMMGTWQRQPLKKNKHRVTHSSNKKIWEACGCGETEIAEAYLQKEGGNINFTDQDFGTTPLMMACGSGSIDTAKMLVERWGANINAVSVPAVKSNWGNQTALHFACEEHSLASPQMIEWLIELGANSAVVDDNGRTAINLAREQSMPKGVITMLEQSGSVISREMDYYVPARSVWKKVHVDIFPVMLEAGRTHGAYRHEMVWHDDTTHLTSASGILSLADYSVHLLVDSSEDPGKKKNVMGNKKAMRRFNIEFRPFLSGGADLHHPTFSMESSEREAVVLGSSIHILSGTFTSRPPPSAPTPVPRATIAEIPPKRRVRFNIPEPSPEKEHRSSVPSSSIETSGDSSIKTSGDDCPVCVGHRRCHCEAPVTAAFQGWNPMYNKQQEGAPWNSSPRPMVTRTSSDDFRSKRDYFERCGASSAAAAATTPKPHSTPGCRLSSAAEQHAKLNAERTSYPDGNHSSAVAATGLKPRSTSGFRLSAEQHAKLNAERTSYPDGNHSSAVATAGLKPRSNYTSRLSPRQGRI